MVVVAPDEAGGNVRALLHEIHQALERFAAHAETSQIDLSTLPLSAEEERILFDALGLGEVEIRLDVMGISLIRETAYAGVWRVEHYQESGELLARHLEICAVPAIVGAQAEDVRAGLERLNAVLSELAANKRE